MGAKTTSRRRAAQVNLLLGYGKYSVGIINQLVLVPVYLRFVSLDVYGAWLASGNILVLMSVLDIGFNLVVTQRLATAVGEQDDGAFVEHVGSALGVTISAFVLVTAVGIALSPWIPRWVHTPTDQVGVLQTTITLAATGVASHVVAMTMWGVLQAWQMTFECEFSLLVAAVLGIVATLISLWHGNGVVAFGVGELVRGASGAGLVVWVVIREWRYRRLHRPGLRVASCIELFRHSYPLIGSRVATALLNNGQPALVSICLNPRAAAILSLTSRVFVGCQTLIYPIIGSAFAGLAQLAGETGRDRRRVREVLQVLFTAVAVAGALMFGMAMALNTNFGYIWVGPERVGGVGLSIAVCIATVLMTTDTILMLVLTSLGDVRKPAWCSVAEVAVRFPATAVLLLYVGLIGAPIAACIASGGLGIWYLALRLRRNLGLSTKETLQTMSAGVPALAACLIAALGLALLLPSPSGWYGLVRQGFSVGGLMVALVLAFCPFARLQAVTLYRTFSTKLAV